MSKIPNSSKYKTTGRNSTGRATSSRRSQTYHQRNTGQTNGRQQTSHDLPSQASGGIGIFWGAVGIIAAIAIIIKYPVIVAGIILVFLLFNK